MEARFLALGALVLVLAVSGAARATDLDAGPFTASASVTDSAGGPPNPSKLDVTTAATLRMDQDGDGSRERTLADAYVQGRRIEVGAQAEQNTTLRFFDPSGEEIHPTAQDPWSVHRARRVDVLVLASTDENPANGWDHHVYASTPALPALEEIDPFL